MIKVLPTLDDGIRLVGFLKESEKDAGLAKGTDFDTDEKIHYIMYSTDNQAIYGVTYSCKQEFGVPSSLVYGGANANNEFTIEVIFPELLNIPDDELRSSAGAITILDTSSLQQNYLVDHGDSQESDADDGQSDGAKARKYRKTKVRVFLAKDDTYDDLRVRVLKFFEIEDDEFRKESSLKEG